MNTIELLNLNIKYLNDENNFILKEIENKNHSINWIVKLKNPSNYLVEDIQKDKKALEQLNNQLINNYKLIEEYKKFIKVENAKTQ